MTKTNSALLAAILMFNGIQSTSAADVTITISGRLVAKACTVSAPSATVDLGNLSTLDFAQAGSYSNWYPVTLKLTGCPEATSTVTAKFSGTADSTGYYKNLGDATNLQLELQDFYSVSLNNGKTKTVQVDSAHSATMQLRVRALTVSGKAEAGSIKSVINVTYTYV